MKIATTFRACEQLRPAARWICAAAMAGLLLAGASLMATTVTTLAGGPQYYNPGSYSGSSNSVYGTLYSQFHTPSGVAFDGSQNILYVADRDNNAIRYLDLNFGDTYTFAPFPPYIPTNLISQPVGVAVDALSDVFVLNRGNGANGTVLEFDWLGDLIATNMTRITNASGIALDTLGNIYVTASNTVFKITPAGVSNVVTTFSYTNTSLQGIVVKRAGPNAGKLAVCDSGRNGIYLIDPDTGTVTTNAGFNGAGDGTGINNRGVANSLAQFFQPSGLAEAGDGSLIVADSGNNRVKVVTASGVTTNLYGVSSSLWWSGTTSGGEAAWPGWSDGTVLEPDQSYDVQARMPFGFGHRAGRHDLYHRRLLPHHPQSHGSQQSEPLPWPPSPPTGPVATAGYGQVYLTWTASDGATNYNVKRSTSSGGETTIASMAGASYTDTNLLNGTTYYYLVSGLNTGGEGQNSVEVSAMPLFSPAPTNLIVTATNYGLVSLAWSISAGATSYNVKRAPSHGGPYSFIGSTAATTYNDTTVVNGKTYYYVVTAVNPGGENITNSPEASATPPLPPVPILKSAMWITSLRPHQLPIRRCSTSFHRLGLLSTMTRPSYRGGRWQPDILYLLDTPCVTNLPDPTPAPSSARSAIRMGFLRRFDRRAGFAKRGHQGHRQTVRPSKQRHCFKLANPTIIGNNAAQFAVSNITANAQLCYTTDGTLPTNAAPSQFAGTITGTNGITLSLPFPAKTNVMTFTVRGFREGYSPSGSAVQTFSSTNFVANTISFGFTSGEASSDFVASPGQTFYAPVTLTTLPGAVMYSLQFNLTVNPGGNTNPDPHWPLSPDCPMVSRPCS